MSESKNAKYYPLPSLSPYVKRDRYSEPKEDNKFFERKIREYIDVERAYSVVDLGCANGELLYLLKQKFPHWKLTGYDLTPEFIETGRNFPGLSGVELIVADLFDINRTFDIVVCDSVLQIFPEIQKPLEKLLSICNEGGYIFVIGLFNKYDNYPISERLAQRGLYIPSGLALTNQQIVSVADAINTILK